MANISAKEVMALRQKTGLSMMECKKALVEAGGDAESAEQALRVKLKGKMDTRSDRAAGEGQIAIAKGDGKASIVELSAETDFTAKNDTFKKAAQEVAEQAMAMPAGDHQPTDEMRKVIDDLRISTGENISIARVSVAEGGGFGSYIHHDGKTAVLLQADGDLPDAVASDICMHITAVTPRPEGVTRDDVPEEVIEREKKLAMDMAIEQGKPEEIAQKMVEGKVNKLYSELALLEQPFVKDDKKKVQDLLPEGVKITGFFRWQVGELGPAGA
jgi:elongation factor Ts